MQIIFTLLVWQHCNTTTSTKVSHVRKLHSHLLFISFNSFQSLSRCIIPTCCISSCYISSCYATTCATRESPHPLWSQYPTWEYVLGALLKWTDWKLGGVAPLDHHGCQRIPHFSFPDLEATFICGCQKSAEGDLGKTLCTTCSSSSWMIWCRSKVVRSSKDKPQLAVMWASLKP